MNQPIKVVCAVIVDGQKVLAAKRPTYKDQGGLWEFPGGKLHENETPAEGIKREIMEELGVDIAVISQQRSVVHEYTTKSIELIPLLAKIVGGDIQPDEHDEIIWVDINEVRQLHWCEADKLLIDKLKLWIE
jgi:8-oxo-dGTP diphosphatase